MKLIRNVSLASGSSFKTVNVLFDEHIVQIGNAPVQNDGTIEEYDFSGCFIMPGAVDMHTHLFNGSEADAETLQHATARAIKGGYTTLADLSYTTVKPIFRKSDLRHYDKHIQHNSHCDIALWGHCDFSEFPYHLNYMHEIWTEGIVGFVILHPSPNSRIENMSYNDIMDLFDTIYDTDVSFAFQGFDDEEHLNLKDSKKDFVEKRLISIRKILRRIQDNPLHFIGIFDQTSLEILNNVFRRTDLTYAFPAAELIAITQCGQEYEFATAFPEYLKMLQDTMKNGKLYTVSTEAGFPAAKEASAFRHAFSGYNHTLLEWTVPWMFSELWKNKRATIQSCIRMLSENPAKRLGLFPQKGCIQKGSDADIVIIDPNGEVRSDLTDQAGKKMNLTCSVKAVFLRGEMQDAKSLKAVGRGQLVRRSGTTRRKSSSSCWS